jgi:hypothetical protein
MAGNDPTMEITAQSMKATPEDVAKGWPISGRLTWGNATSCERSLGWTGSGGYSIVKEHRKLLVSRLRALPGVPEATGALATAVFR